MKNKKNLKFAIIFLFGILILSSFISAYASSRPQYTQSGFGYSSGIFGAGTAESFDSKMCEAGQDFVLQVSPLGCTPSVVRSDLLEEQDTWVFCPITATKINPLIKIEAIKYLTLRNEEFSKYISDIGFHPVRSALGVQDKLTNPVLENIGYAAIKLKRIPTEAEMPDFVEGNVTAEMVYDIENAFGTFRTGFYLKPMKDEEWNKEFLRYGFWRGKGYARAEDVQSDRAIISVYSGNTISRGANSYQQKLATFSLKPGEESAQIYLPTFDYCLGGLKVKLEEVTDPETTARLKINADDVEVVRGERFLDNKCVVNKIERIGLNQKVIISCEEDLADGGFLGFGSTETFELEIKPKIELKIEDDSGIKLGNYSIGEWLFDAEEKGVFLSYAYTKEDSPYVQDLRVVFTALPKEDVGSRKQLTDDELKSFKGFIERYRKDEPDTGVGDFWKESWNKAEGLGFLFEILSRWAISGESFDVLEYRDSNNIPEELGISDEQTKYVTVMGLVSPADSLAMKENTDYKNAFKDFDMLYSDFSSIKDAEIKNVPEYGQQAFEEKIKLARDTGQKRTMFELCEQFKSKYPNANIDEICFNEFEFASDETSSADVLINNKVKEISLRSIYEPTFDDYGAWVLVKFPNGKREKYPLQKEDIVYLSTEKGDKSSLIPETAKRELNKWDNLKECDAGAQNYLKAYWDSARFKESWSCSGNPWSAAFISYVMEQSGVNFPFSASHSEYFSQIKDNPKDYDVETKTMSKINEIKLGDILCQCRDESCAGTYSYSNLPEKGHCDIIVEVKGDEITTIGGNLGDSVKKEVKKISDIKNDKKYYGFISHKKGISSSSNQFIQLKELETISGKGFADVRVNIPKDFWTDSFKFTDSIKLEEGVTAPISTKDGIYEFTLEKVNLKKVAKISVLPRINYADSELKFNFKIGIDKRDIKLAPEKTKERIEKLNKTIEDFEKVSEVMGKTIKGLKGACLGVGGALHIKNLANNMGGKGIARQKVMRGDGGWYEICTNMVNSGTYKTQEQCLIKESKNIDDDVQAMSKILAEQQKNIKDTQNKYKSEAEFLEEKIVNTENFAEDYSGQIKNNLGNRINEVNSGKSVQDQINSDEMQNILTKEGFNKNLYDTEELRDIDLSLRTLNSEASPRMKDSAKANLYSTLLDVQKNSKSFVAQNSWAKELGIESSKIATFVLKDAKEIPYSGVLNEGRISGVDINAPVQAVQTSNGKQYLAVLDESASTDVLTIKRDSDKKLIVYDKSGKIRVSEAEAGELENIYFKKYYKSSYENTFKRSANHNEVVVRYYETEAYKNLPAVVPFDKTNGWYAAARQNLPVLGNIKSFDESGRVNNFYLCNVGADGIEEFFSGIGDDICQQIFLESGKTYRSFPGLSESDAINLAESAVSAIEQASVAKSRNPNLKIGETIRINTRVGGAINVAVGNSAVDVPNIQCQDFMSPKECNIIFNLCDPVICPNSRCDFGGEYPVRDVIQSGMVGSTLLCAPNWKEKIYAPVCLTGIQASLDNVNSVFKGARDCLQTSLDTGEMVGICDEITSVYMCELVWRETAPIAKIGISKVAAKIFGQGTRGGGEYLSVADAWKTAGKSAEYFTQSYGANSYAAFKARTSAEQLATPVCKGFISGVVPKIETFFNAVTEPDSPIQFSARFDEIPYSDVTVPPVSQYKVFYHIYAGNDKPVYYQVYLKPDAEGSLYADASMIRTVASGFIPKGEIATETKDFTAPAGYKKLCINANGQEECRFKEVSTSFAIDYVKDKYAEEQIEKTGVDSEKECVSGSMSLYNLLTPNIQSVAEREISPEIYKRGITRICATNNPGQGTDSSRWIEVGRCSDVGANVKCWLDQSSVGDSIHFASEQNKTLSELEKIWIEGLNLSENYEKDFNLKYDEIEKIEQTETGLREKILKATSLLTGTFFNKQKAKVILLRGKTYAELAKLAYKNFKDKEIKPKPEKEEEEEEKEKPVKFEKDEFKSVPERFVISDTDRNFELFYGASNGQWYVWMYSQEFQYDYSGTSGGPTLTGAKEEAGELVGVGGEWVAIEEAVNRLEEFGGLSEDEKRFIVSFTEKVGDYDSGLKQLIDKTSEIKDGKLIKKDIEMSDKKIFKISELEEIGEIYFYNKNGKWFWNFEEKNIKDESWIAVPEIRDKSAPTTSISPVTAPGIPSGTIGSIPQNVKSLIKSLPEKNFYDGAEIIFEYKAISEEEEEIESEEISANIIDAYNKYKNLFEEYSKKNKPNELEEIEFKALLIAVSQQETNLGASKTCGSAGNENCEDWIMGYDNKFQESSKGAEKQIALSSNLFKRAFAGEVEQVPAYKNECKRKSGNDKIKCILSIYNSGESYEKSKQTYPSGTRTLNGKRYAVGWKYADEVIQFKQNWEAYFKEEAKPEFSNFETRLINEAKQCGDCGTMGFYGFGATCAENVCSEIGKKLNRECEFSIVIPVGKESNCYESQNFLRGLNISTLTANLVSPNNVNNFEWTTQNIQKILENTIRLYPEENGRKYSDNKYFVDQMYKRRFLTEEEYNEIIGEGFGYGLFDTEEDMKFVYDLLKKKSLTQDLVDTAELNSSEKISELCKAVEEGNLNLVKSLIEREGVAVDSGCGDGLTPLIRAARRSVDLEVLKYLVEKGANVNALDSIGRNALYSACFTGNFENIKYLISKDSNVNLHVSGIDSETCLMIASELNTLEVVKYLIEEGNAEINAVDANGKTALDYARGGILNEDYRRIMDYLISKGAKSKDEISS